MIFNKQEVEGEGEARFKDYTDLVSDGSRPSERCFVRGAA